MTFGLTSNGFQAKRLADIKTEIETTLKDAFGVSINLMPSSVLGQIVGIFSERESLLWELAESVYNSQYPMTAEGVALDNVVSITGITRQGGITSKCDLTFFGTVGTIIAEGSIFSVLNSPTSRFILKSPVTIAAGIKEVQKCTFSGAPTTGQFQLKLGDLTTSQISWGANSQDVQDALNGLSSLPSVLVTGGFISGFTIAFDDGVDPREWPAIEFLQNTLDVTGAITVLTEGKRNQVTATVEAETIGPVSAPAGSLTVIENPITGLDEITNILDAELGRNVETDSELKARREASLQRAGAGTLGSIVSILADIENVIAVVGFENPNLIETSGRPPKSFEMVVQGGDEDEIASAIWENKPAGILSFGSVSKNVTDSQGFSHTVKFSRPTEKLIYLELDLTVDATFPANGVDQVKAAILAFGEALGIGQKVIVYPKLVSCLNNIQGLLDIVIRIGTSANPTLDNNIAVDPQEISKWDSSRIEVTIL